MKAVPWQFQTICQRLSAGHQMDMVNMQPFLWNELQGMLNLQELLQTTYEFNIDDWTLTEATGISADGLTIIGNGINPDGHKEAWIATIPEPASLLLLAVGTCWVRRRHQR